MALRRLVVALGASAAVAVCGMANPAAQIRLLDETDRLAFVQWFTFLSDAQFYRHTADVTDCAGLVRHAVREAMAAHSPDWHRRAALPLTPPFADVRTRLQPRADGWPLFRVGDARFAEFADARTIVSLNARALGRDTAALRPGDLLYFQQDGQRVPDHLMVYVGPSQFDRSSRDWIVYHTGPADTGAGEVRKTRLADLLRHPAPRWRPVAANSSFIGVFRLAWL